MKSNKSTSNHIIVKLLRTICCYWCSVTKSCLTLCNPMDYSMPGSSVLCCLPKLLKFMSIGSVMLSNHLIMFHPPSPSAFNLSQHQNLFQMSHRQRETSKLARKSDYKMNHRFFLRNHRGQKEVGWNSWVLKKKILNNVFNICSSPIPSKKPFHNEGEVVQIKMAK